MDSEDGRTVFGVLGQSYHGLPAVSRTIFATYPHYSSGALRIREAMAWASGSTMSSGTFWPVVT